MIDLMDMSPECAVGTKRGYGYLHDQCRQTEDIPLPGASGILLQARCKCIHHRYTGRVPAPREGES